MKRVQLNKRSHPIFTRCAIIVVFILFTILPAFAQEGWALENRGYHDPLIAEPRAAQISITAIAISDELPFVQEPGKRIVWDISLGKEIPIFGYETGNAKSKPLGKGKWGIGFWLPVSFHMIEDFKDPSAPILNTDYRFGGVIKAQYGLTDKSRLGARIQFGHESTHIGDEFSLAARRTKPDFERVNVSYEYWEYGVSFETDQGKDDRHHLKFRHGGIGLISPKKGFYSPESLEPGGRTIPRSASHFEPSFGFEWYLRKGMVKGFGPFLSVDARHRIIYNYRKANDDEKEDRQTSFNILFGLRRVERGFLEKGIPDLFFRYYHGVNPAGQFRSQRNYQLIGVGIYVPL
jgi:hypothetical protein